MLITEFKKEGIKYLELHGRIDNSAVDFATDLSHMVVGESKIIIDCIGLNFINSLGLRAFISTVKDVTNTDGKIVICNLSKQVAEIFHIAGFTSIFKIFDSVDEAKDYLLEI